MHTHSPSVIVHPALIGQQCLECVPLDVGEEDPQGH